MSSKHTTDPLDFLVEAIWKIPATSSPSEPPVKTLSKDKEISDKESQIMIAKNKAARMADELAAEKINTEVDRDLQAKHKLVQANLDDLIEDPNNPGQYITATSPGFSDSGDDFEADEDTILNYKANSEPDSAVSSILQETSPKIKLYAKELSTSIVSISTLKQLSGLIKSQQVDDSVDGGQSTSVLTLIKSLESLIAYYDEHHLRTLQTNREKTSIVTAILALQRTIAILLPREK